MPYVSERQRRFFHTNTARQHGITPALVHEYDAASREKKATGQGTSDGVSSSVGAPKPPSAPRAAPLASVQPPKSSLSAPSPGDYRASFLNTSAAAAQRSTADKLQAGEETTMPVLR